MPDSNHKEMHHEIGKKGNFELVLGSGADCDIPMTVFRDKISPRHAMIKRKGDRLFLQDMGSSQGTFVNRRRIGKRWHEITLHDRVFSERYRRPSNPLLLGQDLGEPL